MPNAIFKNKKPDFEKLRAFGFSEINGTYTYQTTIADGQFQMSITLSKHTAISTQVIDLVTRDEYVLHHIAGTSGAFVGMIKTDYESVLQEVADKCFESDVFKNKPAQQVIQYVRDTYHDELEFLWQRSPNSAILRRQDTQKWYAAMLVLAKSKLGLADEGVIDIINLRISPEEMDSIIDHQTFFPGYHMNKKHWYTICLDGSLPVAEIYQRIDASYQLTRK